MFRLEFRTRGVKFDVFYSLNLIYMTMVVRGGNSFKYAVEVSLYIFHNNTYDNILYSSFFYVN